MSWEVGTFHPMIFVALSCCLCCIFCCGVTEVIGISRVRELPWAVLMTFCNLSNCCDTEELLTELNQFFYGDHLQLARKVWGNCRFQEWDVLLFWILWRANQLFVRVPGEATQKYPPCQINSSPPLPPIFDPNIPNICHPEVSTLPEQFITSFSSSSSQIPSSHQHTFKIVFFSLTVFKPCVWNCWEAITEEAVYCHMSNKLWELLWILSRLWEASS